MRSLSTAKWKYAIGLSFSLVAVLAEGRAHANGFEIPENGTELMGRAGAWTARADNPLAAAYNPAGLAGQPMGFLVNSNFTWQSFCFQRSGSYGTSTNDSGTIFQTSSYSGHAYPKVCKDNGLKDVNIVPQLAFVYPVNEKLGVSFAVVTPSGAGKANWPDVVTLDNGSTAPAPQRYMLLSQNGIVLVPTLAAGYEVAHGIRFGAAFQAVMSFLSFANASHALNSTAADADESTAGDLKAELKVTKWFTPAVVLGAMVSPIDDFDIGAMFRWGADVKANNADVTITGPMYGRATTSANTPTATDPKPSLKEFSIPQPIDVRLGFRFHPLRKGATFDGKGRRDFLAHDQFDIELDLTYSHNKQFQDLTILFPPSQAVALGSTKSAGTIPQDASVPHKWKDSIGIRLGGEYVVLPEKLGVRVGGFFQTSSQDPAYLQVDFLPSMMFGAYLGGTYRLSKTADIAIGYGHVFLAGLDNNGKGAVYGLVAQEKWSPAICSESPPGPDYRTCHAVNSGKVTGGYDMFSLGATFHF